MDDPQEDGAVFIRRVLQRGNEAEVRRSFHCLAVVKRVGALGVFRVKAEEAAEDGPFRTKFAAHAEFQSFIRKLAIHGAQGAAPHHLVKCISLRHVEVGERRQKFSVRILEADFIGLCFPRLEDSARV